MAPKTARNKVAGQVTLTQMLKPLDKDVAGNLERRLKKLSKKKAIKTPLNKNKADQLDRIEAYSSVSKEVTRWEPIIDQNRRAKQIKFPIDQEPDILPTTAETLGSIQPQNELEKQVKSVLSSSAFALHDNKEFSRAEEKYLKAISVEEAEDRHKELQKMRVLLSSYAAKMRRQKRIKSKSYRRLLKHERIRRHVKNVESDKDLLIEEIERLQRLRAKERASLKHKNTGKWAKHAKFRSKYDEEARKAMLEQIGLAEKLLEKPAAANSDSDEDDDEISDASKGSSDEDESEDENATSTHERAKPRKAATQEESKVDKANGGGQLIVSDELIKERLSMLRKRSKSGGPLKDVTGGGGDDNDSHDDDEAMADDNDDNQRMLMSEAFAEDDVVAEFKRAKDQIADEEQPKDVDLYLPGWGGWAGPGIKVNKRKRNKFIIKAKKIPRKDENLGNVIISEQADSKMKDLMVKRLPRRIKDDEQLIKLLTKPTAATFINQKEHREAIKPRIVTKLGARIEPINKKILQGGNKAKWA